MIKLCKICGEAFDARANAKTCSEECRHKNLLNQWRRRPKKNPEKHRRRCREYKKRNPEKIREQNRKYREKNREKIRAETRKWQKENPDKVREQSLRWRKANAEKLREQALMKYHRKTGKVGDALFFQTMQSLNAIAETAEKNT